MKKNLLFIIVVLFNSLSSFAQINKGSVFLGGNIGVSQNKPDTLTNAFLSYYIDPQVGIAIKENTIIGVILLYGKSDYNSNASSNNYGGGFFLRKYKQLGKYFYLFGQGQAIFSYYKISQTYGATDYNINKQTSINLNLYPGISYAVTKKFHLEATINNLLTLSYTH